MSSIWRMFATGALLTSLVFVMAGCGNDGSNDVTAVIPTTTPTAPTTTPVAPVTPTSAPTTNTTGSTQTSTPTSGISFSVSGVVSNQ